MYEIGDRIELHPATDEWMRGDKYGEIIKVYADSTMTVRMDKSRRLIRVKRSEIYGAV